ncbi:hypothetical protein O181_059396 [Austropuccinia psidii MF-1]|uniref:Uncharacterized protein n=1 Tax=Austropuccinia psidii MF-1 TaxID=1389203 RepID=A0A9Q3EIW3_9BASI|nr:hypothetical protein [Austropuccinia psidii MF-1]
MLHTHQKRAVWSPDENFTLYWRKKPSYAFKNKSELNKEYKGFAQPTSQHSEFKNPQFPYMDGLEELSTPIHAKRRPFLSQKKNPHPDLELPLSTAVKTSSTLGKYSGIP